MDKTQLTLALLGSAAIGVIVSSLISIAGQYIERKARLKELLLTKSVDLAFKHTEIRMTMAERSGQGMKVIPEIVNARFFHRQLQLLHKTGKLSADMEADFHDIIKPCSPRTSSPRIDSTLFSCFQSPGYGLKAVNIYQLKK